MSIETILVAGVIMVFAPFWTFHCAKLAAYGFLAGARRFRLDHPTEKKKDAEQPRKA